MSAVLSERRGPVRWITLNRPHRLNAISDDLLDGLNAALAEANACAETRVIVLRGEGRAFCAGDDLKELGTRAWTEESARRHVEAIQASARAIMLGPHPVVGAIHGWAAGGGLEWAINCDFAIMAESTRCFFPETALGMIVTGGVSAVLPRMVGLQKARELILFGEKFDARAALDLGIAWKVVPDGELLAAAEETAARIAALPQVATRDLKRALNRALHLDLDAAMAQETEMTVRAFLDPATRSRAAAFAGKD